MPADISNVTHLVQLALTPAFLLSGIGAILAVLSGRLSRVVDRTHQIDGRIRDGENVDSYSKELIILNRRSSLIHRSFFFGAIAGFCICAVITLIYVGKLYLDYVPTGVLIGWLFTISMTSLSISLFLLMQEVRICANFIKAAAQNS